MRKFPPQVQDFYTRRGIPTDKGFQRKDEDGILRFRVYRGRFMINRWRKDINIWSIDMEDLSGQGV